MISIAVLLLGVLVPAAFSQEPVCQKQTTTDKIDLTQGELTLYYCATSALQRTVDTCYVTLTPKEPSKTTDAKVFYSTIQTKETGNDSFVMQKIGSGEYDYLNRGTRGYIMDVSEDGNCYNLYKCFGEAGEWKLPKEAGDYVMALCKKPKFCNDEEHKDFISKLVGTNLKTGKVEKIDLFKPEQCKSAFPDKYSE